eukprot:COSAG05_NODE_873_length_6834_cov_14.862422_4_plen_851_part_00
MMVVFTMLLLASASADPNVSAARRQLQETLPLCTGNFDGDGDVDVNDLLNVLSSFMVDDAADTDGDGDTDIVDLLNVLAQFGQECHEQQHIGCDGWDFHMTDTFGDGWNCASADIYDCEGDLLATGVAPPNAEGEDCTSWTTHDAGQFSEADLCLPDADGYTVSFTSGAWDYEIGWSLLDMSGEPAMSGGAYGTYTTCPHVCAEGNDLDLHISEGALVTVLDCGGHPLATDVSAGSSGGAGYADVCLDPINEDGYTVLAYNHPGTYNEVSWTLADGDGTGVLQGGAGTFMHCHACAEDQWDFHMTDTYGDGWNCASATITDCEGNVLAADVALPSSSGAIDVCDDWTQHAEGTLGYGDICLPAVNLTITFTSGSWDNEIGWSLYGSDGTVGLVGDASGASTCPPTPCEGNEHDLHMTETTSLSISDCAGNVIHGSVVPSADDGYTTVCLPESEDGVVIEASATPWWDEASWTLFDSAGEMDMTGGSGVYASCHACAEDEYDFHMTDDFGDGWNCYSATITDCEGNVLAADVALPSSSGAIDVCDDWTQHEGGSFGYGDTCIPATTGGYTVTFTTEGNFGGEIGWSLIANHGGVELSGGASGGPWTTCPDQPPSDECADTDAGATDPYGDSCAAYVDFPGWCGGYDDDDFDSMVMCCACGGGSDYVAPPPEPAPEPAPPPPPCWDTDAGATDPYGDSCATYVDFPGWCGNYDDDDFDSMVMCCACGGGSDTEPPPPPTPCWDTDFGAVDPYGDSCAAYWPFPGWCGNYDVPDFFESEVMCCACGGGVVQDTEPEPPPPPPPPPPCADTDAGATDPYGDSCAAYVGNENWCGNYDDDDFDSMAMCCACGGGQ